MAKESMAQLRDRVRKQVTQAHPQSPDNHEAQGQGDAHINSSGTTPQKRRRSRWTNPYPDAMPFQTSVYLTDEDLVIIKSLRLRLHFAREWMVLKYALEELDKHLTANDAKQP